MRIRLLNLWDHFRGSFWFLPTVMVSIAVVASVVFPAIDHWGTDWIEGHLPWSLTSKQVSQVLLSNIGSAMLTVAGIVFSLTVLILSNASSSYGSRVLRSYMQDPVTQFAIGAFVAPSLYCFLLLRHLGNEQTDVPHLSVAVGIAFTVFNFGVLIYFVHHVALAIQAPQIIKSLSGELVASMNVLFPEALGDSDGEEHSHEELQQFNEQPATSVLSKKEGYLQVVDTDRLLELAVKHDVVILLERRTGDFITLEQSIARISEMEEVPLELIKQVNESLYVGSRRTPRQDVECAVLELVEVAVRALSPGINDPFTAVNCIDYLSAALSRLAGRTIPSPYRYDKDHKLRVIAFPFTFSGVIDASFNQIRQCGSGMASVLIRLLERLTVLAKAVRRKSDRDAVRKHAHMVLREAERSLAEEEDLKVVQQRFDECLNSLAGSRAVEEEVTQEE
jgi:uncharacterized membrane protein